MKKLFPKIITALFLLFSFTVIFYGQKTAWGLQKEYYNLFQKEAGYIPKGNEIKPVIFGFDNMVADLYFLKVLQYNADNRVGATFTALSEYLNLVTDLDPDFIYAYEFGARILPSSPAEIKEVVALLKKGIRENPQNKDLVIFLAYHYFYDLEQYGEAIKYYDKCYEEYDDCPGWTKNMVGFLEAGQGKYSLALYNWMLRLAEDKEKMSNTEIETVIRRIEENTKLISLNCAKNNFFEHSGKYPKSLEELRGISISPCSDFDILSPEFLDFLQKQYPNFLGAVDDDMLTSPYTYNGNVFIWDEENRIIKPSRTFPVKN